MKAWWFKLWKMPHTIACDKSPFCYPGNEREQIFHVNGSVRAYWTARRWVNRYEHGQARVIPGHHYWSNVVLEQV